MQASRQQFQLGGTNQLEENQVFLIAQANSYQHSSCRTSQTLPGSVRFAEEAPTNTGTGGSTPQVSHCLYLCSARHAHWKYGSPSDAEVVVWQLKS